MMDSVTTDAGPWFPVPLWLIERVSAGAVKTYAALGAKWANRETRECHPSQKNLATLVGVSRSTVCGYLDELESAGALRRYERKRDDGSQTSNNYRLISVDPDRLTGRPRPVDKTTSSDEPVANELEVSNQNQELEDMCDPPSPTSSNSPSPTSQPPGAAPPAGFARFWAEYPRKMRKQDAMKAYQKALDRDGVPQIMEGLAAWVAYWEAEETQTRFIAHPTTFLNKSDYLDAPPTPKKQDLFTQAERDDLAKFALSLGEEEAARRRSAGEYPYDAETLRRLGDTR